MFDRRFFVLAPNFHGATLLARLLNAHPEIVALGDTYPSNRFDQICGCGSRVSKCGFWQFVRDRVGADRYLDGPCLLPRYPRIFGGRTDTFLYTCGSSGQLRRLASQKALDGFRTDFRNFVEAVYDLQERNRASVYVDGVKSISRVRALLVAGEHVDGVIHLVRDPGDFVKSSMKQNGSTLGVLLRSAIAWRLYHNRAATFKKDIPYIKVNYESLAEKPEETMAELFRFLGVAVKSVGELIADFEEPWHFMGNASLLRFDGRIWRSRHQLGPLEKRVIRAITGYGKGP